MLCSSRWVSPTNTSSHRSEHERIHVIAAHVCTLTLAVFARTCACLCVCVCVWRVTILGPNVFCLRA